MNVLKSENPFETAAVIAVDKLAQAIERHDEAVWVLAGGSTPLAAYEVIAEKYSTSLDWSKVWVCLGDERCVSETDPESNWGQIKEVLLDNLLFKIEHMLQPVYDEVNPPSMANTYEAALSALPKNSQGRPRFDHVWLGIGEDGHTMSLFPGRDDSSSSLVEFIDNAPKPPSKRISLTLSALTGSDSCLVLASGEVKVAAVRGLISDDMALPITRAVKAIESSGGSVALLTDTAAAPLI